MNKHELIRFERELLIKVQSQLAQAEGRVRSHKALTHREPPQWMLDEVSNLRDEAAKLSNEIAEMEDYQEA